ncbi:MAG TPA: LPS assembly lipoprotein LptE [Stellaceae bacterium]|nr:LPS assembly lipoprotein LptE [Stellaceae bacterium]
MIARVIARVIARAIARRRLLVLPLLPAMLAGCGWEAVYADHETIPANADLRAIRVLPIAARIGQRLEMELRTSLNPSGETRPVKYLLRVTLAASIADSGIQSQGLGTRGEATVFASYQLVDAASNAPLQSNTVHASESFDIQANGYSTVVAQDDAYVRTVEEIRREIITRLTLFLQKKAAAAS